MTRAGRRSRITLVNLCQQPPSRRRPGGAEQERCGTREVARLCDSRHCHEGVDVVWRDIENLIKLRLRKREERYR